MKGGFRSVCIWVFALSLGLGPGVCGSTAAEVSNDMCLGCHGPFDKLVTVTLSSVAPSGEKISPHYYVPHTLKEAKAIPECSNCHPPHPTPPTAADITAMGKPSVDWCYTTCHHDNNFTPCNKCHNK
jgi:hypothetical protein